MLRNSYDRAYVEICVSFMSPNQEVKFELQIPALTGRTLLAVWNRPGRHGILSMYSNATTYLFRLIVVLPGLRTDGSQLYAPP